MAAKQRLSKDTFRFMDVVTYGVGVAASLLFSASTAWSDVRDVALGSQHTCVLLDQGVKCFGNAQAGQLGLGNNLARGDGANEMGANLPYVDLGRTDQPVAIAAGGKHTCALFGDGAVKCWGANEFGQLGLGDKTTRGLLATDMGTQLPAVNLGQGQAAVALALGERHSCVLLRSGAVKCWGRNESGQLGQGDTNDRGDEPNEMGDALLPINLGSNVRVAQVSAGGMHTCARSMNQKIKCWGNADNGQLGLGDAIGRGIAMNQMGDALPFVDLGVGSDVINVRAAFAHTCVQLRSGPTKCFGYNGDGRLGFGDKLPYGQTPASMGAALPNIDLGQGVDATDLQCGYRHCCITHIARTGKCWGVNNRGFLGLEDTRVRGSELTDMGDGLPFFDLGPLAELRKVFPGDQHTCALLGTNALKCWGHNQFGQLGLGDTVSRGHAPGTMGTALMSVSL